MNGAKTGGRQAGTPNRRSADAAAKLASLDCDPLELMAQLAMDPSTEAPLRVRLLCELAQYCWPKRKAVELSADPDMPTRLVIQWKDDAGSIEKNSRIQM